MKEPDRTSDRARAAAIRRSYLEYPGETPDVDYKAAISFSDEDFSLDLVRHILGMANAGGGHIVIGFKEDAAGKPQPDPAMDDAITASYDPSSLAAYVEKHIRPSEKIDVRVHKDDPYGGKIYPIIQVFGFERRPYFCRSTKKNSKGQEALKDGALYVRTASARTVEVATPEEWDRLITLCVRRQQDEFLVRFTDLLEGIGFSKTSTFQMAAPASECATQRLLSLVPESRSIMEDELRRRQLHPAYLEVAHVPIRTHQFDTIELFRGAERSVVRRTGWPIGVVLHRDEAAPQVQPTGISAMIYSEVFRRSLDYWRLERDGAYYFTRTLGEDEREGNTPGELLYLDTRIWRIAEAFEHARLLYQNLGTRPRKYAFTYITLALLVVCSLRPTPAATLGRTGQTPAYRK